nr:retrovirus-related Pol polyprotein from transposon TNT 1-94 [Tanacetum cinerariifolium]
MVVQKSRIQCYNCKELGHVAREYAADDSRPIFDTEPLQKVQNNDHYNVFAIECEHSEQSKYVHDTYPIEQDEHNVIIDSLDMSYDRKQTDRNDDDDLANERDLLASLIEKLKVITTTSVSRPRPKSNPIEDRVKLNNSQGNKQEVEDHHRNVKFSKNKTKTVASESTNQKPRNTTRKLYEHVTKTCSYWYPKFTPSGYKWKPKSQIGNVNPNVKIILFIIDSRCSKHMTGNLKLLINFVEKFLGTVKFGNDQITPILGYGDLVQRAVTIKRVYYVEGLIYNLFSVGQFCDADLEVAFRKSTCYIHDLKGNNLLIGSRGTDLYSITLQDTSSPNLIFLMAKATSSQAWLWHRRLSHLNFDTINLLSRNDIVIGLPKLKFVKDHLCSSCELGKAKRKSFQSKITPSSRKTSDILKLTYQK